MLYNSNRVKSLKKSTEKIKIVAAKIIKRTYL